jgi:hypothetical protein
VPNICTKPKTSRIVARRFSGENDIARYIRTSEYMRKRIYVKKKRAAQRGQQPPELRSFAIFFASLRISGTA